MAGIDLDTLRHALGAARRLGLSRVELELGGEKALARLPLSDPEEGLDQQGEGQGDAPQPRRKPLTATVVGYFHAKGEWVEGAKVAEGKPVGEIQALGLANDIPAPFEGVLVDLAVQEGDSVEFGQVLAYIVEQS